jgi:hypothetical protein
LRVLAPFPAGFVVQWVNEAARSTLAARLELNFVDHAVPFGLRNPHFMAAPRSPSRDFTTMGGECKHPQRLHPYGGLGLYTAPLIYGQISGNHVGAVGTGEESNR